MIKRILAVLLASLMLCGIFASCGEKEPADVSSKITASEEASSEETEISSLAASSEVKTSSLVSKEEKEEEEEEASTSSKKGFNRGDTNSETGDSGVKQYKNAGTFMLGSFHFSPTWCTAYGTDHDSRIREFKQVVEQKYFNTYFLPVDETLLEAAKIVAENGGTFWVGGWNYKNEPGDSISAHIDNLNFYFDMLKKEGLWDLFNGFIWDEPMLNDATNDSFLEITKTYYQTFGKRNFPVFAVGEYLNYEGNELNLGITADDINKLEPRAAKYLTDIAFDAYSVDVREGASNGGPSRFAKWQESISPNVVDGKSYYTELKRLLIKHIGHPANFWYYPCAYLTGLYGGLNSTTVADEDYCIAHLNFMAEDVMKEQYGAGCIIYTYYTFSNKKGFGMFLDIKDAKGNYVIHPEEPKKWEKYCDALRETTKKFNSVKTNLVKLSV